MGSAMTLRTQLVVVQMVIVFALVLGTGVVAVWFQEQQLRESYEDRMVAVAQSVATLPAIIDAYDSPDPSSLIQPIAEVVRDASDVTYVVVTDLDGIRFSHPNPELIGKRVSTDPSAAILGEIFVGTQTGTLGESWRVKVPVFDDSGALIGQVSVGILETELYEDFTSSAAGMLLALAIAAVVGVVAAAWAARAIRRRIYGLEPEEIRTLLETRDAMLHQIGEGLVAVDGDGKLSILNDAAAGLLGIDDPEAVIGRSITEVFDEQLVALFDSSDRSQQLVLAGERVLLAKIDRVAIDDRALGSVVILRDRTELDAVLRDLEGAQSIAQGLRAQQHEFANTLHTVSGMLELGQPESAVKFIERVTDGGPISGLEADPGIDDIEVSALLLAKRARARELGITIEVAEGSVLSGSAAAAALRDELITVIGNLLDNAIEACGTGGSIELTVEEHSDGSVFVQVDDDGPGVDPELRERIFALGVSSKASGADSQRGYGLTIVDRVAKRLGTRIEVERSTLGGAQFRLLFPGQSDPAQVPDASRAGGSGADGANQQSRGVQS
ncbi:ATP-binding protein [Humidisolicoccus flavus]|uniref:ATP-binding protein n=1 Tax=Humidisolicoccus flavus TaxID=3111414 RepID=UPI003254F24A